MINDDIGIPQVEKEPNSIIMIQHNNSFCSINTSAWTNKKKLGCEYKEVTAIPE